MLNIVQFAAFELIQSDARFLYTLVDMQKNAKNLKSNYVLMCQPYIGIFADGAEQWCRKMNFDAPKFNEIEKKYYTELRGGHKLFEKSYIEYKALLLKKFYESNDYFYKLASDNQKRSSNYYNVGADLINGIFCGNTITFAMYNPAINFENPNLGCLIREFSIVAGKLANFFIGSNPSPYSYDNINNYVRYEDYHFYKNCPIKIKNSLGFVLFSILCSINYITQFIEKTFFEEIPQKFKFAYLQYYYLCDFIEELNRENDTKFCLNKSLKNRNFRNCIAHYGLGQFLTDDDVDIDDVLKGLTCKAFNMDYYSTKNILYTYLNDLSTEISNFIF